MKTCFGVIACALCFSASTAIADSLCPPNDGLPWKLYAATEKVKEPEIYLVLGESQNVPTVVCNCTATANDQDSKTVWVGTWKRPPSQAEQEVAVKSLIQSASSARRLQSVEVKGQGAKPTNTANYSTLDSGSCLIAVGYSVQVIHNDKQSGRNGKFQFAPSQK